MFNFIYVMPDGCVATTKSQEFDTTLAHHAYLVLKSIPQTEEFQPHVEVVKTRYGTGNDIITFDGEEGIGIGASKQGEV